MNLHITGRHIEVSPHLKAHIQDKMRKLERYAEHITESEIVLFKESSDDIAEGKIHLSHTVFSAKGEGVDMYSAVNELVDKLAHQLHKYEGRMRSRKRQPRR
jgi:putative sigma-54 modulation protein